MSVPGWAKRYLDESSFARIEKAVAAAETRTSGEILPMIVRRSSATGHVWPTTVLIFLVVLFPLYFELQHWGVLVGTPTWQAVTTATFVVVSLGLGWTLAQFPFLQRWLTNRGDLTMQVLNRARLEFYEADLHLTRHASGILLMVSLMEHQVVVLADPAISDHLPPETWAEVRDHLLDGIRQGDLARGFDSAIGKCGEILAKHLPIRPDDTNEIHDALVIKE